MIPGSGFFIGPASRHNKNPSDTAFFQRGRDILNFPDRSAAEIDQCFKSDFCDFMNVQTVLKHGNLLAVI